mgnify:CR=1 FL=1
MKTSKKREFARDLVALGSIPFYFIVFIRAIITEVNYFIVQLAIAAIAILISGKVISDSNLYTSRALVLFTFTSLYYQSKMFTLFSFALIIALFFSAKHLKSSTLQLFRGALVGVLSSVITYYLEPTITALL